MRLESGDESVKRGSGIVRHVAQDTPSRGCLLDAERTNSTPIQGSVPRIGALSVKREGSVLLQAQLLGYEVQEEVLTLDADGLRRANDDAHAVTHDLRGTAVRAEG